MWPQPESSAIESSIPEPSTAAAPAGKRTRTQMMSPSVERLAERVAGVLQRRFDGGAPAPDADARDRAAPAPVAEAAPAAPYGDPFGLHLLDGNGVRADAPAAVAAAQTDPGAPLPATERARFEGSLGVDLGAVRVHTGPASEAAAAAVSARAFTIGDDIHFAAGQLAPGTPAGDHLLAHEVAHTVQQGGGAPHAQARLEVSTPDDPAEHEADRAADAMVAGLPAVVTPSAGVARQIMRDAGVPSVPDAGPPSAGVEDPAALAAKHPDRAIEDAAQPDPADLTRKGPLDWDALASPEPGPRDPGVWTRPAVQFAQSSTGAADATQALTYRRADGKVADPGDAAFRPRWYPAWEADTRAAVNGNRAFLASYDEAVAAWNDIVPDVTAFYTAARDADAQGLHGLASEGQFDAPAKGKEGANLDEYGDAQQVGKDGARHALASLFANGGTTTSVATDKIKKGQDLDTALQGALASAEENLLTSALNLRAGLISHKVLHNKAKEALAAVDIVTLGKEQLEVERAKTDLVLDKARWGLSIDTATKVITGVIDIFTALNPAPGKSKDPLAAIKSGVSIAGTVAKTASDVNFDNQIYAKDKAVFAIRAQLLDKSKYVADLAVLDALLAIDADRLKLETLRTDLRQKLRARKAAYDAAADAASANALANGATSAEAGRVNAAVRAIPVVETVLARIQKVSQTVQVPTYSPASGLGFRLAQQPTDFVLGIRHLKGYRATFKAYEDKWQGRLTSLQSLAGSLYSK